MPARRTTAGASNKYGRYLSRRQWRLFGNAISVTPNEAKGLSGCSKGPSLRSGRQGSSLNTRLLEHLVRFGARLLERIGGGHALEVDLVPRARPDIAHARAFRLGRPRYSRRLEVLGNGLEIAAAAPCRHDLLDARVAGNGQARRIVVAIA